MNDTINIAELRRSQLFSGLSDREAGALSSIAQVKTVGNRQLLFLEGDRATGFFILLSGSIRIFRSSRDGLEYTLHRIRPGQMFAEAAIFEQGTFPASAVATEESRVLYIPRDPFFALIRSSPEIAVKIMGALSAWLRDFADKLESLSMKGVLARLAEYLLHLGKDSGSWRFVLPTTKTEIARELGTVSETLSRSLRKLQDQGVIFVEGPEIRITDPKRLRMIAEGHGF